MLEKTIECPSCKTHFKIQGEQGASIKVKCPTCQLEGITSLKNKLAEKKKTTIQRTIENPAIEVQNLKKIYDNLTAVNGISFSLRKGEVFAFLGPNGAGKTTTVEMIESIRKPTSGKIKILGYDIDTSFNKVKERIGILPQEFKSFERLTVRESLIYYSKLYKNRANIDNILKSMDLKYCENKLYKDLSGGMKQRVGVAISLVNDPDIVFLDEPSTGLDPKARREVWEVIANLRNKGKTVFLTTHYMEEAEYLADYIAIIHKGNIIASGTIDELIKKYGNESIINISKCVDANTANILNEKGFKILTKNNGNISIKIEYKDQMLEVLSTLRHECIEYGDISVRRSNLEEVFLNLTGSKLSEGKNEAINNNE